MHSIIIVCELAKNHYVHIASVFAGQ